MMSTCLSHLLLVAPLPPLFFEFTLLLSGVIYQAVLEKQSYMVIGRHDVESLMRLDPASACLPNSLGQPNVDNSASDAEAIEVEMEMSDLLLNLRPIKQVFVHLVACFVVIVVSLYLCAVCFLFVWRSSVRCCSALSNKDLRWDIVRILSFLQENLIRDDNKLILLASLSDSLEYVADSIERQVF